MIFQKRIPDQSVINIFGNVSDMLQHILSSVCRIMPYSLPPEQQEEIYPLFLQEISSTTDDFSTASKARDQGLTIIGWVTGSYEVFPMLLKHAQLFSQLLICDTSLLRLCYQHLGHQLSFRFLPVYEELSCDVLFGQERNQDQLIIPYHNNVVLSNNDYQKWYKNIALPMQSAFETPQNGQGAAMALVFPASPEAGHIDPLLLKEIASNRNVLLPASSTACAYWGDLVGAAHNSCSGIAWAQMLQKSPRYAKQIRAVALRFFAQNFTSHAICKRFLNIVGIDQGKNDGVIVLAACEEAEEVYSILEAFRAQSLDNKRLVLFYDGDDISVNDSRVLFQPKATMDAPIVIENEYCAVWLPQNYYGPEYLKDLMCARYYAYTDCIMKAPGFAWHDGKIIEQPAAEYQQNMPFYPHRGIIAASYARDLTLSALLSGKHSITGSTIDSFQFVENGSRCKESAALSICWEDVLAPLEDPFIHVEMQIKQEFLRNDDQQTSLLHIPADTIVQVSQGTFLKKSSSEISLSIDTLDQVIYVKPMDYQGKSFQAPTTYNIWPGITGGKEFNLYADLKTTSGLDAILLLVFYDHEKQIKQIKLSANEANSIACITPDNAVSCIALLRLKGKGIVNLSDIWIKGSPASAFNLSSLFDKSNKVQTTVIGSHVKHLWCSFHFEGSDFSYLIPESFSKKFSSPPTKTFFPELVPGQKYMFRCRGWSSATDACLAVLVLYDDCAQLQQIRILIGGQCVFTMPKKATKALPLLRMSGKGQALITDIMVIPYEEKMAEVPSDEGNYYALLTNHYPSNDNLYANMFVHTRVKAYRQAGLQVCVFVVQGLPAGNISRYEFEGVPVLRGASQDIIPLLRAKPPKKILVHFINRLSNEVLENAGQGIPKIIWCHGADVYPTHQRLFNMKNFRQGALHCNIEVPQRALVANRLTNEESTFVPVSQDLKNDIEASYGITFPPKRCYVIHNYVNTNLFAYFPKKEEMRFRIVSVKSYATRVYAGDLVSAVIHELAQRPCFSKLDISLYGQGQLFYPSLKNLAQFPNVHINRAYLTQNELAALYQSNGILLIPTRHDTQGVSRDEAMACGMVPVTNDAGAVAEFVDKECGFVLPPEDVKGMADAIEAMIEDPALFLRLSLAASQRVRRQSDFAQTLQREIDLINEEPEYKTQSDGRKYKNLAEKVIGLKGRLNSLYTRCISSIHKKQMLKSAEPWKVFPSVSGIVADTTKQQLCKHKLWIEPDQIPYVRTLEILLFDQTAFEDADKLSSTLSQVPLGVPIVFWLQHGEIPGNIGIFLEKCTHCFISGQETAKLLSAQIPIGKASILPDYVDFLTYNPIGHGMQNIQATLGILLPAQFHFSPQIKQLRDLFHHYALREDLNVWQMENSNAQFFFEDQDIQCSIKGKFSIPEASDEMISTQCLINLSGTSISQAHRLQRLAKGQLFVDAWLADGIYYIKHPITGEKSSLIAYLEKGLSEYAWFQKQRTQAFRMLYQKSSLFSQLNQISKQVLGKELYVPGVSILTVSNKPENLPQILSNFRRQNIERKELVIVFHCAKNIKNLLPDFQKQLLPDESVRIHFEDSSKISFGFAINKGICLSRMEYIAKFDDDDYYCENFLTDIFPAFDYTDALVCGRLSFHTYLEDMGLLVLRKPGNEYCYTSFLPGATLVAHRKVFDQVMFRDIPRDIDGRFGVDCAEAKIRMFSVDGFQLLVMRNADKRNHTWKASDCTILQQSLPIYPELDAELENNAAYFSKADKSCTADKAITQVIV